MTTAAASALLFAALGRIGLCAQVCKPTDCFKGDCEGTPVIFSPTKLPLFDWGKVGYTDAGSVTAYKLQQDDFGIFLHGPLWRPQQRKPDDWAPPLLLTGTLADKIWRLNDFRAVDQGEDKTVSANMRFIAWAAAPSTLAPIPPAYEGGPERYLVAEGNPFVVNPGNHTMSAWLGGVDLIDEEKCTTIFPTDFVSKTMGKVVNTVECHPSGFCFFSVWKFYDDSLPASDDCMWWCRANNVNDPTSCTASGVVKDMAGKDICHKDGTGAVHGLKIGKTDTNDANVFDILLMFTGKGTFDAGDSSIVKMQVQVNPDSPTVKTRAYAPWGTDLTEKSVDRPKHDTGVDHAWIDDEGKHVWVGTFRKTNNGVHMLDYDTGKLLHTIRGFSDIRADKYNYVSGISGIGSMGKPGSLLAVATCEEFGQQFMGGTSDVVLIDISKTFNNSTVDASVLVV